MCTCTPRGKQALHSHHTSTLPPCTRAAQADAPADLGRLKQHLKDSFSSFNACVERIYATQSSWTIPDAMLREAVKRVVKNDVLRPYQDFLRRWRGRGGGVHWAPSPGRCNPSSDRSSS